MLMTKNVLDTAKDWGRVSSQSWGGGIAILENCKSPFQNISEYYAAETCMGMFESPFPFSSEKPGEIPILENLHSINLNFRQFLAKIVIFQLELLYKIMIT